MFKIQNITNDARQSRVLLLQDGSEVEIEIYFIPMQYGWFITRLAYKDFVVRGIRIVNSPNILNQYKNILPFGIACITEELREPSQQQDFSGSTSSLYLLSADEVVDFSEFLSG